MPKGEILEQLLNEGDKNHSQMRQLFLKNNLSTPELNQLPEADKVEWYRLKSLNDELAEKMCSIINEK